jgi:hypothetical protein
MHQDYADLLEMAKICARHAREVSGKGVASELWKLARDYQERAAQLDGGTLPDIGEPPSTIR